jgi:hypothetical protein
MCKTDKNTAEKPVVMREAKTWKLHVNATIWDVPSRFGSSLGEVPQTWPTDYGFRPSMVGPVGHSLMRSC